MHIRKDFPANRQKQTNPFTKMQRKAMQNKIVTLHPVLFKQKAIKP